MAAGINTDLNLRFSEKSLAQVRREVLNLEKKLNLKVDYKGLLRTVEKASEEYQSLIQRATNKGVTLAFARSTDRLEAAVKVYESKQKNSILRLNDLTEKLQDKNLKEEERKHFEQEAKLAKKEHDNAIKQFREDIRLDKLRMDKLERQFEELGENFSHSLKRGLTKLLNPENIARAFEGAGEHIENAFGKLKAGDVGGGARGAASGLAGMFKKVSAFADVHAAKSGGAGMGSIANLIGGLSGASTVIAGVVGGLAAVLAVVMELDGQAKDLNKTILAESGAMDVVSFGAKDLTTNLNLLRKVATNVDFQMRSGLGGKEILQTLGELDTAGTTYATLTKGSEMYATETQKAAASVESLQNAVLGVNTYAKLLGVSTSEMSQEMTDMADQLGTSLEGVQSQFSQIAKMAAASGFGTKRFTAMLLQATSSMTMYNLRVTEFGALLTNIGKIMGKKAAGELTAQAGTLFQNEDALSFGRRFMTTGGGRMSRIARHEATAQAVAFGQDFNGANITDAQKRAAYQQGAALIQSRTGANIGDSEGLIKALSHMTEENRSEMISELRQIDTGMANRTDSLIDAARGTRGGMGNIYQAQNSYGPVGRIMEMIQQGMAITGQSANHSAGQFITSAALQNMGMSPEQQQQAIRYSRAGEGNLQNLRSHMATSNNESAWVKQMRDFGMAIDNAGNLFKQAVDEQGHLVAGTRQELGSSTASDAVLTATRSALENVLGGENAEPAVTMDQALGEQIAQNTLSIGDKIEMGVTHWLEQIYDEIQGVLGFLGLVTKQLSPEETRARSNLAQAYLQKSSSATNSISELSKNLTQAQTKTKSAGSVQDRTAAEKEVKAIQGQIDQAHAQAAEYARQAGSINRITDRDELRRQFLPMVTDQDVQHDSYYRKMYAAEQVQGEIIGEGPYDAQIRRQMNTPGALQAARIGVAGNYMRQWAQGNVGTSNLPGATVSTPTGTAPTTPANQNPVATAIQDQGTLHDYQQISTDSTRQITAATGNLQQGFMNQMQIPRRLDQALSGGDLPDAIATAIADENDKRGFEKLASSLGIKTSGPEWDSMLKDYMGTGEPAGGRYHLTNDHASILKQSLDTTVKGYTKSFGKNTRNAAVQTLMGSLQGSGASLSDLGDLADAPDTPTAVVHPPAHDFVFRGGARNTITPIDREDMLMGGKAGGPLDQMGGGGSTIIQIYGGDQRQVFNTVKQAMRARGR